MRGSQDLKLLHRLSIVATLKKVRSKVFICPEMAKSINSDTNESAVKSIFNRGYIYTRYHKVNKFIDLSSKVKVLQVS